MLKRFKSIFLLTLISASSLYAGLAPGYGRGFGPQYGNDCCNSCWGNWKVDAEFLYFLPTFDDTGFVIQDSFFSPGTGTGAAVGTRLNNDFGFCPGFRVGVAYGLCGCCDGQLEAYYTRVRSSRTRTVTDGFLTPSVGSANAIGIDFIEYNGSASSELDFLYQRADGFYRHSLWCNDCITLDGLYGVEFAYLRLNEHYEFVSDESLETVSERSRNWGIGPQFGFDFGYLLCQTSCCLPGTLSLVAKSSASLIVSRNDKNFSSIFNDLVFINVTDEHTWRIIPALHARVGLNYATCFSCWKGCLEIGYEFSSYVRGLSRLNFPDDVALGFTNTQYYNFDMQGLYVAFNACF